MHNQSCSSMCFIAIFLKKNVKYVIYIDFGKCKQMNTRKNIKTRI